MEIYCKKKQKNVIPKVSIFRGSEEKLTPKATFYFTKDELRAFVRGLSEFEKQFTEYTEAHQGEKLGYTHFHFGDFYKPDEKSKSRDIVVYVNLDE